MPLRLLLYPAILILTAAITLALMIGYVPPYSWIANAQIAWWSTNWVTISFFVTYAIVAAPFFALFFGVIEPRMPADDPAAAARFSRLDVAFDGWPGKMVLIGTTMFVLGGWFIAKEATTGPLTPVSLRTIERGDALPSRYVDLEDAQWMEEMAIPFQDNSSHVRFVPLFSGASVEQPAVFAKLYEGASLEGPALRGTLEEDGLPGEISSQLRDRHLIGETHYVLRVNHDPSDTAFFFWMTGGGLVTALAGLFFVKRRAKSLPLPA